LTVIQTIPIFPLDLVLFPRQELQLRIFEPRYKQLVDDCMLKDGLFGVCLIREDRSVMGWDLPHDVGTMAKIVKCQDVDLDGLHLNIDTMGRNPFRIKRLIEPSIPMPENYDPLSVEGHQIVVDLNERDGGGGAMYIRAEVEMLSEIDGDISLPAWENLVFLWKKKVEAQAGSSDSVVDPHALDGLLKQFYLQTDTPTIEYVYSLCALGSSVPADLQNILEATTVDELLVRAVRLMEIA